MKNIYVFTGLGADERIFHKINFGKNTVTHIKWITPTKNETLINYSGRLAKQITAVNPILIGLSFGGMVAVEVAKLISVEKIILISSAKSTAEIPSLYKFAGKIKLHKIVNAKILVKANKLTNKFFAVRSTSDKKIISSMIGAADTVFLNWAINEIVHLQNTFVHPNLIHIHGTADNILPFKYVQANIAVKGGTHLMILNKADVVQQHILDAIK